MGDAGCSRQYCSTALHCAPMRPKWAEMREKFSLGDYACRQRDPSRHRLQRSMSLRIVAANCAGVEPTGSTASALSSALPPGAYNERSDSRIDFRNADVAGSNCGLDEVTIAPEIRSRFCFAAPELMLSSVLLTHRPIRACWKPVTPYRYRAAPGSSPAAVEIRRPPSVQAVCEDPHVRHSSRSAGPIWPRRLRRPASPALGRRIL